MEDSLKDIGQNILERLDCRKQRFPLLLLLFLIHWQTPRGLTPSAWLCEKFGVALTPAEKPCTLEGMPFGWPACPGNPGVCTWPFAPMYGWAGVAVCKGDEMS